MSSRWEADKISCGHQGTVPGTPKPFGFAEALPHTSSARSLMEFRNSASWKLPGAMSGGEATASHHLIGGREGYMGGWRCREGKQWEGRDQTQQ